MSDDSLTLDKLAKIYMKIRDAISATQQEYDTKIEQLKAQQQVVATEMKDRLQLLGVTSAKTAHGTVMLNQTTRFYTDDWDTFKKFLVEHDALDLLERRIAQTNMRVFLEENPETFPPGVNTATEIKATVRRNR